MNKGNDSTPRMRLGFCPASEARAESVAQYVRRRHIELLAVRGIKLEAFIDSAALRDVAIQITHELLQGAGPNRRPIRPARYPKYVARIWGLIASPFNRRGNPDCGSVPLALHTVAM